MIRYGTAGEDRIRIHKSDSSDVTIYGYAGDDVLITPGWGYGESVLYGGGGNDFLQAGNLSGYGRNSQLYGGAGVDTMVGGYGWDEFYVDNRRDVVRDSTVGDGDIVFSTAKFFELPDNVEDYFMDYSATGGNLIAIGNSLGNYMVGLSEDANRIVGRGGNDYLSGGADLYGEVGHADTLIGGMGTDVLGGSRDAIFKYNRTIESDRKHGVDLIRELGSDARIDLSKIDANPATAGVDDSFVFIGTDAFSEDATGQVRYQILTEWRAAIYISTDADPEAEMEIISATWENSYPVRPLTVDDFIL